MNRLHFVVAVVFALLLVVMTVPAFAHDTVGGEVPPVFDFGMLSVGGEIVMLPFSDGPQVLAGASMELARAYDFLTLNALLASNFTDRNMAGLSLDVSVLEAISYFNKSGVVKWMQANMKPSIGIGAVAPINGLFAPNEYELAIHVKIVNVQF